MPWKERYTISDEKSLADDEIRWPQGARCCVGFTVDLSVAAGPDGIRAADLKTPEAEFGANQGLSALLAVLKRYDFKATFAVPAVLARVYADQIRALVAAGHEIAAHGFKHEDVSALECEDERERIARATEIIAEVTGRRPEGWFSLPRQGDPFAGGTISPNTMDLLLEAGYGYMGNGLADDIPHYWVTDFASRRAMLTLPYYYHFDDQFLLLPFRRSVFPDVSAQGHRPRTSRRLVQKLEGRIRRAIQALSPLPHDPAPAAYRLVQPAAIARRFSLLPARLSRSVEPDRSGVRAPLAGDISGERLSASRTEHLAGLPRQP